MRRKSEGAHVHATAGRAFLVAALGACSTATVSPATAPGQAVVSIAAATDIPADAQCAHVVATRLSDFQVSEYKGQLAGAVLQALTGDHHITATAYPQPCTTEPTAAPWVADDKIASFVEGANTLELDFHNNVDVTIDPVFNGGTPAPLVLRDTSVVRTGRNGEGASGPNYSLDGWLVKAIPLPPAAGPETVVFTTEGKGLAYTPRGIATPPDGTFVFQLGEILEPLHVLDGAGNPITTYPVVYPAGMIQWGNTDGLAAIDADHFVRTGSLASPINCDASGAGCVQAGLDILTKETAPDGSAFVQVTQQILLPELPTMQLNLEYPVGVAAIGTQFAVTTLPDAGGSRLVLLNADGSLAAGPTAIPGDVEGLFADGTGRIIGVDYNGNVSTYDAGDLAARGETASFPIGVGYVNPLHIAYRSAGAGSYIAINSDPRLVTAAADFSSVADLGIDLSDAVQVSGLDYRPETDELVVMDFAHPNTVRLYNLTSLALDSTIPLSVAAAAPLRSRTVAYIPGRQQFVTHYRRPGGAVDATLDAVAFINNLDGTPAGSFDLRPLGFRRIVSVKYVPAADELLFEVADLTNVGRLLVTDAAGHPRRSYTLDAIPFVNDFAPITNGPNAGDVATVEGQPATFARVFLP